ncbi:unnamed protein product [Adineta steineri]|uniref:Basal body-orientation factor 1 n=1 Tax=Adineta steineri TaxID=433720 RepID=A0A813TK99_9BILA|nr:unnamed protein product [Adineta steineri]CAF1353137.1 unnamed protein product [Adineta steineri]
MPKKGKGKGKGKGKKGKKAEKAKAKEQLALKNDLHNSNLWEAQLNIMELSRKHYRDIASNLAYENESLRDHMRETEHETIDVVTFLKKQDANKDTEIDRLQQGIQQLKMEHRQNKDELVSHFTKQRRKLDEKIARKETELEAVRQELNESQDLRKKKIQMQKELEDIRDATLYNEREHKETLQKLEQKFFIERIRLQQESKEKIEEIAARAQEEALKGLGETSRNVYRENTELIDSIRKHKHEFDILQKEKDQLKKLISSTSGDKELNDILIKEKVEQIQKQNNTIKELKEKIQLLENSLTQFIQEFNVERTNLVEQSSHLHESSRNEILKLQRTLELKTKEMIKIKKLAKIIIEQRSELETFFLDALQHVKKQINFNRLQYRKDAFNAYQNRMLNAHHGQGDYPKIRTFNETFPGYSTNSVFHDLEEATKWTNLGSEVDIGDLTWEQKEQVLRALFLRMNSKKARMTDLSMNKTQIDMNTPSIASDRDNTNNVFVTQTPENKDLSESRNSTSTTSVPKLPQITAAVTS